jgi:hypothetical protein
MNEQQQAHATDIAQNAKASSTHREALINPTDELKLI